MAAEHLTQNLNVAFHLVEIRTGIGLKPLYSGRVPQGTREAIEAEFRDVIDQARGDVGAVKRKNAERLKDELAEAWATGGSSRAAVHDFVAKYLAT